MRLYVKIVHRKRSECYFSKLFLYLCFYIAISIIYQILETSSKKLKKYYISNIDLSFYCSNKLFKWSSASHLKKFSRSQLFLRLGQNNFWNKIPIWLDEIWDNHAAAFWQAFLIFLNSGHGEFNCENQVSEGEQSIFLTFPACF